MAVGQEIRQIREAKKISQIKAAADVGMSVSGWSQIETGSRNPSAATLEKMARALDVEVRDFFPLGQAPLPLLDERVAGPSEGWAEAYAAVGRELIQGWEKRDRKWDHFLRAFVNSLPEERRAEVSVSRLLLTEYADWTIDTCSLIRTYVEGVLGKRAVGLDPGLDRVCDRMLRLWSRILAHSDALLHSVAGKDDPEVARFREQLEAQDAPGFEARYRGAAGACDAR